MGGALKKYPICLNKVIAGIISLLAISLTFFILFYRISLPANMALLGNNSVFSLLASVGVFVIFKDIQIKRKVFQKAIAGLSACSLSVYLIPEHGMIRDVYWNWFDPNKYLHNVWMLMLQTIVALAVLWIAAWGFRKLFEIIWDRILNKRVDVVCKKLARFWT